ncbi:MAG TPA: 16S rRNA (adenine(1518)-N(6)/adenine(1519)-N(6))-dimethyltransferase RsmA [Chitinophagales bacterium]|nr:16S rRNA (adenine(1518)-N(6)/adenine(1519)-N(6))-dimethyltransferase RsmA [Chitinophagales bacterium]
MRKKIEAKKSLGQHFLKDENIARKIADDFLTENNCEVVLEIGPGTGVLTKYFLQEPSIKFFAIETDARMVVLLRTQFPAIMHSLIYHDFLTFDLKSLNVPEFSIVGNFPYNISSQILFRVFENKEMIPFVMGMFQKEVAQRIAAKHGNKAYGILSVLMQAFYNVEFLFEVGAQSFVPPPKVKSAVISLKRKKISPHIEDENFLTALVKAGFNQRRKTLRNSLIKMVSDKNFLKEEIFAKRAEQLSVEEWIELANRLLQAV